MIFMHIDEGTQTLDSWDSAVQPVSRRLLDCVDEDATQAFLRRRQTAQSGQTMQQQAPAMPMMKISR